MNRKDSEPNKKQRGDAIEALAASFLIQHKHSILERNYFSRWGEIDIISEHHRTIIFTEVRYRANANYGGAAASIDNRKQKKLIKTAHVYIQSKKLTLRNARFDVIAVSILQGRYTIDWLKNAFEENSREY